MRESSIRLRHAIIDYLNEVGSVVSVRNVFYAMVVRNQVDKTKDAYRRVQYQLKRMRQDGTIPYHRIADNHRWQIKPKTYNSLRDAMDEWQQAYRRDIWAGHSVYVEIWVEKDALASVISDVTWNWNVPLMVVRGYSSITFLHTAAETIKEIGKPAYIYHFGDHDPSGVDASNKIERGLKDFGANIHYKRIAVTLEQIHEYNLPAHEIVEGDPRNKKWGSKPVVELDALPVPVLKGLVEDCIKQHIDDELIGRIETIEKAEFETLEKMHQAFF